MWPGHRLDIGTADTVRALLRCVTTRDREHEARLAAAWAGERGLVCLSVRSAFDLLLGAFDCAEGDEVVFSAVTHPDMARIAELHGLRVIPVEIAFDTLVPDPSMLRATITARTRAVVVAQLFGGRADLSALAEVLRPLDIMLIEDCAQGFVAVDDTGDPAADVSLFSFGMIKTQTALGGALAHVSDAPVLRRMTVLQQAWPRQQRRAYARKALVAFVLTIVARPRVFGAVSFLASRSGLDLDRALTSAVRGFARSDETTFLAALRQRPSTPLAATLAARLAAFEPTRLARRASNGELLSRGLRSGTTPGSRIARRTHWLLPVVAPDPARLAGALRRSGVAVARTTTSIVTLPRPAGAPAEAGSANGDIMTGALFVPTYPELDDHALRQLTRALAEDGL